MLTATASAFATRSTLTAMAAARPPPRAAMSLLPLSTTALRSTTRSTSTAASTLQRIPTRASSTRGPQRQPAAVQPLALSLLRSRAYATMPNQEQVAGTFGTSFLHFLLILSKVARIIVYMTLGLALTGAAIFEGIHQYVERVSMPRVTRATSAARLEGVVRELIASRVSEEELACFLSWAEEAQDDAWAPPTLASGGTDSRLGLRGRHALRSAFIAAEWGAGTDPAFFLNSGSFFGRPTRNVDSNRSLQQAAGRLDQSLIFAERFLLGALQEAELRGLRLPEPAVQRAQLLAASGSGDPASLAVAGASVLVPELDPTVLTLEMKLASIRERQGTTRSSYAALQSYERIFDALSSSASPLDSTPTQLPSSTAPTPARLVRIATKIGTLYHSLGHRDEAQSWLLRAVELASGDRLARLSLDEVTAPESDVSQKSSSWAFWKKSSKPEQTAPSQATLPNPTLSTDAARESATPALTRALISALLGLSAWYASPPAPGSKTKPNEPAPTGASWLASLEEAVRVQSSALHLVRLEQARLALAGDQSVPTPPVASGKAERLHARWVELNDATLCVHLAETLYGLQAQPQHGRKTPGPLKEAKKSTTAASASFPAHFHSNRYVLSLSWLHQAAEETADVLEDLATPLSERELKTLEAARARRNAKLSDDARAGYAAVENALPLSYRLRPEWRVAPPPSDGKKKTGEADLGSGLDPILSPPVFRILRDASRMQREIKLMMDALAKKGGTKSG
ncbi:hypothetical protein V8E36_006544 [Tilletia maclaganii]